MPAAGLIELPDRGEKRVLGGVDDRRVEREERHVGAVGGELKLLRGRRDLLGAAAATLEECGLTLEDESDGLRVSRWGTPKVSTSITTEPFPGFATDLQAQFMALMAGGDGVATLTETIFENRFMHVPELLRMGADVQIEGSSALVRGVDRLKGAPVMATDLRASVSLVIAGLAAEGETTINRVYHLDRGFEALEAKLGRCGAQVERIRA